jgi:hypothetical protein
MVAPAVAAIGAARLVVIARLIPWLAAAAALVISIRI